MIRRHRRREKQRSLESRHKRKVLDKIINEANMVCGFFIPLCTPPITLRCPAVSSHPPIPLPGTMPLTPKILSTSEHGALGHPSPDCSFVAILCGSPTASGRVRT